MSLTASTPGLDCGTVSTPCYVTYDPSTLAAISVPQLLVLTLLLALVILKVRDR
jgi:hypothetical protein